MKWLDNKNIKHTILLYNALYFPDSLVNIISVSKLGINAKNTPMNIQFFTTYSNITWNQGYNSMAFHYSALNLPELTLIDDIN